MGKYASAYVDLMQDWVGKNEKDGSHIEIINIYNEHRPLARNYKVKQKDSWCATTLSAAAIKLGYTDIMPLECSCGKLIEKCQKMGIWIEDDAYIPTPGQWIFYDWDDKGDYAKTDNKGWPEHVGCVEAVAGGKITVIEGNKEDSVCRRVLNVNGKNIRGYAAPKYDPEPTVKKKTVAQIAKECIDGMWGVGAARKRKLIQAGYDYAEVQKKVNELLDKPAKPKTPVKKVYDGAFPSLPSSRKYYQEGDGYRTLKTYKSQIKRIQSFLNWAIDSGLTVDGEYGPKTKEAVLKFQKKTKTMVDGKFGLNTLTEAKMFKK